MGKLLALIGLGQKIYGRWLTRHLVSGVLLVAVLALFVSILICALLLGLLYAGYHGLLFSGATPLEALGMLSTLVALMVVGIFSLMDRMMDRLKHIPHDVLKQQPATSRVVGVFDAFRSGLAGKRLER